MGIETAEWKGEENTMAMTDTQFKPWLELLIHKVETIEASKTLEEAKKEAAQLKEDLNKLEKDFSGGQK